MVEDYRTQFQSAPYSLPELVKTEKTLKATFEKTTWRKCNIHQGYHVDIINAGVILLLSEVISTIFEYALDKKANVDLIEGGLTVEIPLSEVP